MKSIHGITTLLSEHHAKMQKLKLNIYDEGYVEGPQDPFEVIQVEEPLGEYCIIGQYCVTCRSAEKYLVDRGLYIGKMSIGEMLTALKTNDFDDEYLDIVKRVSMLYAAGVDGLSKFIVERDKTNSPTDLLPAVLPQDVVT